MGNKKVIPVNLYCNRGLLAKQLIRELQEAGYSVMRWPHGPIPLVLYNGGVYSGYSDIRRNLLSKMPANRT